MEKPIFLKFTFWLLMFLLMCFGLCGQQNVAINTTGALPDSSAIVDIQSQERGLLIPRMSSAQRMLIRRPARGLLVFDTDHNGFWFYDGAAWRETIRQLADADADTHIQVEQQPDEDAIRLTTGGQERLAVVSDGRTVIGGGVPAAGAILELNSTDKAFLPPRLNFGQIQDIPQPTPGMLVYDREFHCLRVYNGHRWECLQGKVAEPYRPPGDSYGLSAGGATGDDIGWHVATDVSGNVYLTGYYEGKLNLFGQVELDAVGESDVFLVKLDPQGSVLWALSAGGVSYDQGHGLAVDPAGNILIAGSYRGSATFGGVSVAGYGDQDIFVASFTPQGQLRWVQTAGSNGQDEAESVATDSDGNVYVTGEIWAATTFGDTVITSAGYRDVFLAMYDQGGAFQWAQRAGGAYYEAGGAVMVGLNGLVYVAGHFSETADFAGTTLTSQGETDLFLAAFEPDGSIRWARAFGGAGDSYCKGAAADENGNLYLAGDFEQQLNFGSVSLSARGYSDAYLAKIAPEGTPLWARSAGSAGFEEGWGPAVDAQGFVYFTGGFQETVDLGPTQLTSGGIINVFLAKYDEQGHLVWAEKATSSGAALGTKVTAGAGGVVFVTGAFQGDARFGDTSLTSAGGLDVFLWKYVE